MRLSTLQLLLAVVLSVAATAGCASDETVPAAGNQAGADAHDHSHEHSENGPHGGHLIELGRNHEYHAELVDADGSLTVYILDVHMEEVAIDESLIILNLHATEQNSSHELATATPNEQSHSRFVSSDAALLTAFESETGVSAKLRVTIKGVPYVGTIAHHAHDHASHVHAEHDDDHGLAGVHDDETTPRQ